MILRFVSMPMLIMIASLGFASNADAQMKSGKSYALLIGINQYDDPQLKPLKYSEADMAELAELLKNARYEVILMTSAAEASLKPTHKNIHEKLGAILKKARKGDRVVVAFSGHGLEFARVNDKVEACLCPTDASPLAEKRANLLALGDLTLAMENARTANTVVFIDACREEVRAIPGVTGGITSSSIPPRHGVAAFYSCSAGENAFEHDRWKHGVFFHHVLSGLKGAARDHYGDVTFANLVNHVKSQVPKEVQVVIGGAENQKPEMNSSLTLDMVLNTIETNTPRSVPERAVPFEDGLTSMARKLLETSRAGKYDSIGVLKFMLKRAGDPVFTDDLGTMNRLLARRLETALVMNNSPKPQEMIKVLEDPSLVAAGIEGASHLSEEGLNRLFAATYPLAWGEEKVQPQALVVGYATIAHDLRSMTLNIYLIDSTFHKSRLITEDKLVIEFRPDHLVEVGESVQAKTMDTPDAIAKRAAEVRTNQSIHPLIHPEAPFKLDVLYDKQPQKLELREGQIWIPEPRQGQKVELQYTRRDTTDAVYAIVLKVNGENTLFREKLPDAHARAWISEPTAPGVLHKPQTISAFQISEKEALPFRVASREESEKRKFDYGSDVGTISITVFPGTFEAPKDAPLIAGKVFKGPDEAWISRSDLASIPRKNRASFPMLQAHLYDQKEMGLIVEGGSRIDSPIHVVPFQRDANYVMSGTIYYYPIK